MTFDLNNRQFGSPSLQLIKGQVGGHWRMSLLLKWPVTRFDRRHDNIYIPYLQPSHMTTKRNLQPRISSRLLTTYADKSYSGSNFTLTVSRSIWYNLTWNYCRPTSRWHWLAICWLVMYEWIRQPTAMIYPLLVANSIIRSFRLYSTCTACPS